MEPYLGNMEHMRNPDISTGSFRCDTKPPRDISLLLLFGTTKLCSVSLKTVKVGLMITFIDFCFVTFAESFMVLT